MDEAPMLSFAETVRMRRSYRDFLPTPVPEHVLRQVLEDAQLAPSNCNTQPWDIHIVSGAKRVELSRALHNASSAGSLSPDFSWDTMAFPGKYGNRRRAQGAIYYRNLGIEREDHEGRAKAAAANFSFFNAPHVAMLFMPMIGDCVRVAADIGMYGQTFLLALAVRSLGGVPQTNIGLFANTVREVLGVPADLKLLYGISFGYPNTIAAGNRERMARVDITESVTFHTDLQS